MSDFKQEERLSRQRAAERLIDIAYALTAGGPLELRAAGRRMTAPVGNELHLERALKWEADRVELVLGLTWSSPQGSRRPQATKAG